MKKMGKFCKKVQPVTCKITFIFNSVENEEKCSKTVFLNRQQVCCDSHGESESKVSIAPGVCSSL